MKVKRIIILLSLFFILSLSLIILPWHSSYIYSGSDVQFHINRIVEFSKSIGEGYPKVNFYTFNNIGYDVNSYYPTLSMYLFVPLFLIVKNPINGYYLLLLILLLLTQIIMYYSARVLKMSQKNGIIAAALYTFSEYMCFIYLFAFELGEGIAFIAFPLVLVALISYISPNLTKSSFNKIRDVLLIASLAWITYSHLLSIIFCLLIVIIVLLWNVIRNKSLKLLRKYIVLGCIYLLCTSFYWINFITAYLKGNIIGPERFLDILNIQQLIDNSITNSLTTGNNQPSVSVGIGIILLVSLIVLVANFSNLRRLPKILTILGVIFLILSTNLFCWSFLSHYYSFIKTIQFTFRFIIIVVLTITFAVCLYKEANSISTVLIIICIVIFNINISYNFQKNGEIQPELNYLPSIQHQPKYANFKVNAKEYKNLYQGFYGKKGGPIDYLTKKQVKYYNSIAVHNILANNHKIVSRSINKANSKEFKLKIDRKSDVDLPVLKTTHKYQVTDNGIRVPYTESKRGTIQINEVSTGRHFIKVYVLSSYSFKLSILLTIIGFLTLLCLFFKHIHLSDRLV